MLSHICDSNEYDMIPKQSRLNLQKMFVQSSNTRYERRRIDSPTPTGRRPRDDVSEARTRCQTAPMLFHDKLDIKLIRLVRENPVLYDHNNAKYMDFNMREVTWQKIGDELKRSAADCKVRWINIRDVYRRILRKNMEPGQRTKMYKYENEVSFLRPYYKDVTLQNEEFESDERSNDQGNDDCGDEAAINSDNSNEPISKPLIKSYYKSSVKKKKKRRNYEEVINPLSTPTPNDPPIPSEFDSTDPVDAFLLSIGATLKTFSPYHLNLAKSKIFSVVQEHDLQQIVQKNHQNESTPHDIKISTSESIYMQ